MTRALDPSDVTEDALLGGRVRLLQPRHGHRAGTDAVLLAGLAPVRPDDSLVDLGSASGAVGLMIAARVPGAKVTFVERDLALAELCRRNIALNGLGGRGLALVADVFADGPAWRAAGLALGEADLVATNPPFFEAGGRASPSPGRRAARSMDGGGLSEWLAGAARLLRPRGRLALVHRADHLDRCLAALVPGFGSVEVRPVHGRAEDAATRVVLIAVKGGRAALRLLPPLVLHGGDGRFTPAASRLHGPSNDLPT